MSKKILYHIFEKNDNFFLVDSFNQLFWNLGTDLQQTAEIQKLVDFGFFTEKAKTSDNSDEIYSTLFEHIVINPSTDCNLNCWFCYSKEYRTKNKPKLEFEDIQTAINIIMEKRHQEKQDKKFGLSFGYSDEITLDFNLFNQVKNHIDGLNQDPQIEISLFLPSTNLMVINDEFINYVNEYGHLVVSIDLMNENQKIAIIKNLERFHPSVKKYLVIPVQANISPLLEIYKEFSTYFDYVSTRPVRTNSKTEYPWNDISIRNFKTNLTHFFQELSNMNDDKILQFLLLFGPTDYIGRYIDRVITRSKVIDRCPAGKTAFALSPELKLYPCSGLMGNKELEIGHMNVKENEMIIDNTYLGLFTQSEECFRCPIRYFCGGPCLDWLYKQNGDLKEKINRFECQINIHLFEEVVSFLYRLIKERPYLYQEYIEKKELRNGLNYYLEFESFSNLFSI